MKNTDVIYPEPVHEIPDIGPIHRGGGPVIAASLLGTLGAVALCSLLARSHPVLAWLPAVFLGAPSLWGWWCTWQVWADKSVLPRSHSLLAGALGFDIPCASKRVAVTAFFFPDRVRAGKETRLLIFLENYASRQRIVHVRILCPPALGLGEETKELHLHLAAGQAAVYELPVRPCPGAEEIHRVPVVIQASAPNGHGLRLPGARRSLYDIRRFRYAVPLTVEGGRTGREGNDAGAKEIPSPAYRTLASVDETDPKLTVLRYCDQNK